MDPTLKTHKPLKPLVYVTLRTGDICLQIPGRCVEQRHLGSAYDRALDSRNIRHSK